MKRKTPTKRRQYPVTPAERRRWFGVVPPAPPRRDETEEHEHVFFVEGFALILDRSGGRTPAGHAEAYGIAATVRVFERWLLSEMEREAVERQAWQRRQKMTSIPKE